MSLDLVGFCRVHGLGIGTVQIEPGISPYPRTIMVALCPECDQPLYLYNRKERPDPIIASKIGTDLDEKASETEWLASCWTGGCSFYLPLEEASLLQCPHCSRHFMNEHHLWDHMMFQCTTGAREEANGMSNGLGVKSLPPMVVSSPPDRFVLDEDGGQGRDEK